MDRFLQVHFLTFYPPSNVNRDDTGKPKTAHVGGATRLRISSQSLKRAWRTSSIFEEKLEAYMGKRTQRFGREILAHLQNQSVEDKKALKIAQEIAGIYGKLKKDKNTPVDVEQLVFISPAERKAAFEIAEQMAEGEEIDVQSVKDKLLHKADSAVDIALFGRMLADNPDYNWDAAAQVAHAITTHRVTIEDDYFTAVDDLKTSSEDAGSAHIGEMGFSSGVFYLYLCVNRELFLKNLGLEEGSEELISLALGALIEAAAKIAPAGKQNSFAAFAQAHYVLAEKGNVQPRTLAGAFTKPVMGTDLMTDSIESLKKYRKDVEKAYGAATRDKYEFEVGGEGSLAELVAFCQS